MLTAADFKLRFPEFSSVSDARVTAIIDEAAAQMSEVQWAKLYGAGLLHLSAHKLCVASTLEGGGDVEPGPIKREKVGDVQQDYAVNPLPAGRTEEDALRVTPYGRQYLELKRLVFPSRTLC